MMNGPALVSVFLLYTNALLVTVAQPGPSSNGLSVGCERPKTFASGSFTISEDYNDDYYEDENNAVQPGSEVSFQCDPGHVLLGQSNVLCMENNQWQSAFPECQILRSGCKLLKTFPRGNFTLEENENEDNDDEHTRVSAGVGVKFQCDPDYRLLGPSRVLCKGNDQWDSALPRCQMHDCKALPLFDGGYWKKGRAYARLMCNEGYVLKNPKVRFVKCLLVNQTELHWRGPHGETPMCIKVTCVDPGTPENGKRHGSSPTFQVNSTVLFSCFDGYKLIGSAERKCMSNGQWDGTSTICTSIGAEEKCSRPPVPVNGWIVGDDAKLYFASGETVTYECEAWYDLLGSAHRTCMERGWTGTPAECKLRGCPPPPKTSGVIFSLNRSYQTVQGNDIQYVPFYGALYVKCPEGQKPIRTQQAVCQLNGTWSIPTCVAVVCRAANPVVNGYTEGISPDTRYYQYNHRITHHCKVGYSLVGTAVRYCREGGWTDELPSCQEVSCPKPDIRNGVAVQLESLWPLRQGGTAKVLCNQGFKMVGGSAVIECKEGGTWNDTLLKCAAVTCELLEDLKNGRIVASGVVTSHLVNLGTYLTYTCDAGYELKGHKYRKCETDGWSGEDSVCEAVQCKIPADLENGRIRVNDQATLAVLGTRITYFCRPGYELNGPKYRWCEARGWSDEDPVCQAVQCEIPADLKNGHVSVTGQKTLAVLGTRITYSCDSDYRLIGPKNRWCEVHGWSDEDPFCQVVKCRLPDLENGSVYVTGATPNTVFGMHITYICHAGYELKGPKNRWCGARGWSDKDPVCQAVTCKIPADLDNGYITVSSQEPLAVFGTRITYSCHTGYELKGPKDRWCVARGWSDEDPVCQAG